MSIWPCNCPLCRMLVHPILRRFTSRQKYAKPAKAPPKQTVGTESRREVKEVNPVKLTEAKNVAREAPRHASAGVGGQEGGLTEKRMEDKQEIVRTNQPNQSTRQELRPPNIARPLQAQMQPRREEAKHAIPEEVKERIEKLERELSRLRSELREALESISDALVDVRAAVIGNINPFFATNGGKSTLLELGVGIDAKRIAEVVKAMNEALDKFSSETLIELIDSLAESGSMNEANARVLKTLVKAVSEMRRRGIGIDEQIRLMTLILGSSVKSSEGSEGG